MMAFQFYSFLKFHAQAHTLGVRVDKYTLVISNDTFSLLFVSCTGIIGKNQKTSK